MEGSNRDLWQLITGSFVLRQKVLVDQEIKRNKKKLLLGLNFFKKPVNPAGEILKKERNVEGAELEFVGKLSRFLALDEEQADDLFRLYLVQDYRGSLSELQNVLTEERLCQSLTLKVRDFYYTERLYLLRCIKHIWSHWQDTRHPFREAYADFVEEAIENEQLIKEIHNQYNEICAASAPTWEKHGKLMNEKQATIWMAQNLREQCELLEIMLLHYKDFQFPQEKLPDQIRKFKTQGFGVRQTNKHLLEDYMEPVIHRIGFLQTLLILEAVDLEHLYKCYQNGGYDDHHVATGSSFQDTDSLVCLLGDSLPHGPLLLMWSVLRHLVVGEEGTAETRKLGNAALQLDVFGYLSRMLDREPFSGKTTIAVFSKMVICGLLSLVLTIFHEETLGNPKALYGLAAKLMKEQSVSEELWDRGLEEGLGMLLHSTSSAFPWNFGPLVQLCKAMASSSKANAKRVKILLDNIPTYTESLDRNSTQDLEGTEDETRWILTRTKMPYGSDEFIIPRNTMGELFPQEHGSPLIQWEHSYSGWQLFLCETQQLLRQAEHGAGAVMPSMVERATGITGLLAAMLESDPTNAEHFMPLLQSCYLLIQRFSVLTQPPVDLVANCLLCICHSTNVTKSDTRQVWHNMQQTGLLPYMTENLDNFMEISSGAGLHAGVYGSILAAFECTRGKYPVTMAMLQFVTSMVQPLDELNEADRLIPCLLFIVREIFPAFHKWRYYDFCRREQMGQKCLLLFHKILNIIQDKKPTIHKLSLRQTCVYSLLYTEAGRALLDIISTGVDTVEAALASQGSVKEGVGMEMIHLIRLSFSVLNRLLLLRPSGEPPSPVEQSLSSWPANRTQRHLVATIAQYIYHRQDPRLPTLATLLLKRLAVVFPMSILACLGRDAEAIRDMFLARLQADTEDVRLKVVTLELLATCVETQPALTETFLDVQLKSKDGRKEWSIGECSCLETVLSLIEESKQGTYRCPSELVCAAIEFIHALWYGGRETAMEVLSSKPAFWPSVCLSIMRDLPRPGEDPVRAQALQFDVRTCANIWRIIAHELYSVKSDSFSGSLKKVLQEVSQERRVLYWSKYLQELLVQAASSTEDGEELLADNKAVRLLLAWRALLLVVAVAKPDALVLDDATRGQLLQDLMEGLHALFAHQMSALTIRLASIGSGLYFTLIKYWKSYVKDWPDIIRNLEELLTQTCANSETLIPSVQTGILGSLTLALHFLRTNPVKEKKPPCLSSLVPTVCALLQQSTYQLRPHLGSHDTDAGRAAMKELQVKLKLQVLSVCLLEELLKASPDVDQWLPCLKQHSIFQLLISSVQDFILAKQGLQYVRAVLLLFQTLSYTPQAAESLAVNSLTQSLCLASTNLYSPSNGGGSSSQNGAADQDSNGWEQCYLSVVQLYQQMLATLRYSFLEDAFNLVGTHQDRMFQCMESVRFSLHTQHLKEAEVTCSFLHQLAHFRREWLLHLPAVLSKLVTSMLYLAQSCISYLIRPRLLQCLQEKQTLKELKPSISREKLTPVTRRLSQQSVSSDDSEHYSEELVQLQIGLLKILSNCLSAMRCFSPDLCEIMLDQSMDVSEYEPLLSVGFSTPAVDQETPISFGALVSCIHRCTMLLVRHEHKSSPAKSPNPNETAIPKDLLMYVLENSLLLVMAQAVRYLREPGLSSRDKQLLKRELGAELNSFLTSMTRYLRRGVPSSPADSPAQADHSRTKDTRLSISFTVATPDQTYFKLVNNFVKHVLR